MVEQKNIQPKTAENTTEKISFPAELVQEYMQKKIKQKKQNRNIVISVLSVFLVAVLGISITVHTNKVSPDNFVKGTITKQEKIVAGAVDYVGVKKPNQERKVSGPTAQGSSKH